MKAGKFSTALSAVLFLLLAVPAARAESVLSFQQQGGASLPGTPSYYWWYGCSPTSAGMMLGFYDINGYRGQSFANLVPGGTAEMSTFPSTPGTWQYIAQSAIASPGHVQNYYGGGYNASGDDVGPFHANNSLADFMGTSQDSVGNPNGASTFYYFPDGTKFTAQLALDFGVWNIDAMYGITEYVAYRGYRVNSAYTQATSNVAGAGFSFNDFKNEIDQGRTVMVQVQGHSMLGFGYNDNNTINLYDTWNQAAGSMAWGGAYSGLTMWGVTVLDLVAPEPGTLSLAGLTLLLAFRLKGRRAAMESAPS